MNNYHSPKNELKRELAMSNQKEAERKKEERQRKREMKAQIVKKKNGRPAHPYHQCGVCFTMLETALKKHDHEKWCPVRREKLR
jgi:hypothetical protein